MQKRYRVLSAIAAFVVLVCSLGAMFITQHAGLVAAALTSLKFEAQPGNPKMIGAPPQFKVSKATIDYLVKLQNDGKTIEVENDGEIKIK